MSLKVKNAMTGATLSDDEMRSWYPDRVGKWTRQDWKTWLQSVPSAYKTTEEQTILDGLCRIFNAPGETPPEWGQESP